MSEPTEPGRQIETLRERISALTAAFLRISTSLDLDTVLHEIAETARALTGARYAVITTIDDAGRLEDAVPSGFTPEEKRQVVEWTDNLLTCPHAGNTLSPYFDPGTEPRFLAAASRHDNNCTLGNAH